MQLSRHGTPGRVCVGITRPTHRKVGPPLFSRMPYSAAMAHMVVGGEKISFPDEEIEQLKQVLKSIEAWAAGPDRAWRRR